MSPVWALSASLRDFKFNFNWTVFLVRLIGDPFDVAEYLPRVLGHVLDVLP